MAKAVQKKRAKYSGGGSMSTAGARALEAVTEAVGRLEELVRSQPVASVELGAQLAEVVGSARLLPSGSTNKGSDGNKHRLEIVAIAKRIWNVGVVVRNATGKHTALSVAVWRQASELIRDAVVDSASLRSESNERRDYLMHTRCYFHHKTGVASAELGQHEAAEDLFAQAEQCMSAYDGSKTEVKWQELLFSLRLHRATTAWALGNEGTASALLESASAAAEAAHDPVQMKEVARVLLSRGQALLVTGNRAAEGLTALEQALAMTAQVEDALWAKQVTHSIVRHQAIGYLMLEDLHRSHACIRTLKTHGGDAYFTSLDSVLGLKVYKGMELWGTFEADLLRMCSSSDGGQTHAQVVRAGIALALDAQQQHVVKEALAAWLAHHPDDAALAAWLVSTLLTGKHEKDVATALDVTAEDQVMNLLVECDQRGTIESLLWNAATERFQEKAFDDAAKIFSAVAFFVVDANARAKCDRLLALCAMGKKDYMLAYTYLQHADTAQPDCVKTAFLLLKVSLEQGDSAEAKNQAERIVKCLDCEEEFLALAAREAESSTTGFEAAKFLLQELLRRHTPYHLAEDQQLASLIRRMIEIYKHEKSTQDMLRMYELFSTKLAAVDETSLSSVNLKAIRWFAGSAFNDGLTAISERRWSEAAVLMQCTAVCFGALHSMSDDSDVHRQRRQQRTALLVGAASFLENARAMTAAVPPVAHPSTAKGGESADDMVEKAAAMLKEAKALTSNSSAEKPPAACPLEISSLLLQAEVDICQGRKPAVLAMLASSSHLLPSDHLLKFAMTMEAEGPLCFLDGAKVAYSHALKKLASEGGNNPTQWALVGAVCRHLVQLAEAAGEDEETFKQAVQMAQLLEGHRPTWAARWMKVALKLVDMPCLHVERTRHKETMLRIYQQKTQCPVGETRGDNEEAPGVHVPGMIAPAT